MGERIGISGDGFAADQRRRAPSFVRVPPRAAPQLADVVRDGTAGGGRPLDDATRAVLEPRFGHDFSRVRVHTDARASASAERVRAEAYTVGPDIVFAAGRYAPGASAGTHLLAHELAHVVQQGAAAPRPGAAPAMLRTGGPMLQRRPVCLANGACYEVPDDAPPQPGELNYTPAPLNASIAPGPEVYGPPPPPAAGQAPSAPQPAASTPAAAGMVGITPGGPGPGGPPMAPPEGPIRWPRIPGETPFRPPTVTGPPAAGPGVGPGVGPGAGTGLLRGLGFGVGTTLAAVGVGLGVFLWSRPTAPAWMDTINPITGGPYPNQQEYDRVRRLTPDQIRAEREARRASLQGTPGAPGGVQAPPASQPVPVVEPVVPPPLNTPANQNYTPAQAPGPAVSQGPLVLPGLPGGGRVEAGGRGRGGRGREIDSSTIDPLTGAPYAGDILHDPPPYDPATGEYNDPATGVTKQSFTTVEGARANFQEFVEPTDRPLHANESGATTVRTTNLSVTTTLHIPVYGATGRYVGTIYRNQFGIHTFYTWGRGSH